jgi:hypothetical protein
MASMEATCELNDDSYPVLPATPGFPLAASPEVAVQLFLRYTPADERQCEDFSLIHLPARTLLARTERICIVFINNGGS